MDLNYEKRDCLLKLRAFSHGSLLCNSQQCIQCNDGDWEMNWSFPLRITEVYAVPGEDFSEL
jgi:hypothetical protein